MNRITRAPSMIALALASFFAAAPTLAQTPAGTAFTYQGQLTDAGSPATGSFDFQFQLFDAAAGGNQIGLTLDRPGVAVNAGLFTVSLDFGQSPFAGDARWLEILVRPASGGAYTPIAPRTPLTPAPYAIMAERVVDGPYTFAGDPDTGVFHPAADTIGLAAGGTQVVTVAAAGLSATTTAVGGAALRGTGPGAGLGDGVVGITGTGGRGVLAQNTSSGTALLAASAAGDHLVAGTPGIPGDPVLRITNAGSVLAEGTLAAGNVIAAGPPLAFNSFGNPANKDEAAIASANDVYVEGGLEVDGAAFVDGNLRLGGQSATDDDVIFFDTGTTQSLRWEDLSSSFRFSSNLTIDGASMFLPANFTIDAGVGGALLIDGFLTNIQLGDDSLDQVGIGRASVINQLEVEGSASKTTAGSWLANSDQRLKTDIQGLDDALGVIRGLRPVRFRYNEKFLRQHPSVKDTYYHNYIAQEFQEVFPDSVQDDGEGFLQMDSHPADVYAVGAIQELDRLLAEKDARIADLEERVGVLEDALTTRLARWEKALNQ